MRRSWRLRSPAARLGAIVLALTVAHVAPARGQSAGPPGGTAEPYVPVDHWSRTTLRRLASLGLVPAGATSHPWPLRRSDIRGLMRAAAARADSAGLPRWAAYARGTLQRFERDFRPPGQGKAVGWARVATGWTGSEGQLLAGEAEILESGPSYPGPVPVPDASSGLAAVDADGSLAPALTASLGVRTARGDVDVPEAHVSAALGPADVWAGRRSLSLGTGRGSGLVIDGAPFDGAGVELARGVRLPWIFRSLGPFRGLVSLARMERSGPVERPWFLAMRASVSPHRSLSIGLNRAALFGGEGNEAVTPQRIALMLVGLTDTGAKDSDFENQVASVDAVWTRRVGGHPLTLYGEFAVDDVGFTFFKVPALQLGAEIVGIGSGAGFSLGVEHTSFADSCCGHPPWYQHAALAQGWTDDGVLLGHPLGGNGSEWALTWSVDAPGAGLFEGRFFVRDRSAENLLAPAREGSSLGGRLAVHGDVSRLRLRLDATAERGRSGWWAWTGAAFAQVFL